MTGGPIIGLAIFFAKLFAVYFVFIWIRATLPRIRVDQILDFNWKLLVPVSLAMLLAVAILDKLLPAGTNAWARMLVHLSSNLIIGLGTIEICAQTVAVNAALLKAKTMILTTTMPIMMHTAMNLPHITKNRRI